MLLTCLQCTAYKRHVNLICFRSRPLCRVSYHITSLAIKFSQCQSQLYSDKKQVRSVAVYDSMQCLEYRTKFHFIIFSRSSQQDLSTSKGQTSKAFSKDGEKKKQSLAGKCLKKLVGNKTKCQRNCQNFSVL